MGRAEDGLDVRPGRRNMSSTPERIRTSNLRFRRPMLYPIELRVRVSTYRRYVSEEALG